MCQCFARVAWGTLGDKFTPIGYRGLIDVYLDDIPEIKPTGYKAGDLVQFGAYRLRVVEHTMWNDVFVCAWDTPLGWLQVVRAKMRFARDWFVHRLIATARIWGLIAIDREYGGAGIKITRVLWCKVGKKTAQ